MGRVDEARFISDRKFSTACEPSLRAGIRAMRTVLASIRLHGSTIEVEDNIATVREIFELQDMPLFLDTQRRFRDRAPIQTAAIAAE
jgi:hypothetical protein